MSEASYRAPSLHLGWESGLVWTLVASVLLHAVLLAAGLVLYPAISSTYRHLPRIYTISLVALPGPVGPAAQAAENSALYALGTPEEEAQPVPIHETLPNIVSLEKSNETPLPMPEDAQDPPKQALAQVTDEDEEKTQIAKSNETAMDRLARRDNAPGQAGPGINGRGGSPALNAVARSNPLPPLPKTLHQPYLEVGLVVTPTGIAYY